MGNTVQLTPVHICNNSLGEVLFAECKGLEAYTQAVEEKFPGTCPYTVLAALMTAFIRETRVEKRE